jgi:hypothetical protein
VVNSVGPSRSTVFQRVLIGPTGAQTLAADVDVLAVLSFTTAVDVAVARGPRVYPYRYRDDSAATFANSIGAKLAATPPRLSLVDVPGSP